MGEAVTNESELALLHILFDWVEELFLADLKLAIGPSWDLNDHVQYGLLLVGIEGDVVEGRNRNSILLDIDAVLEGVRSSDFSDGEFGGHVCVTMRRVVLARRGPCREVGSDLDGSVFVGGGRQREFCGRTQ